MAVSSAGNSGFGHWESGDEKEKKWGRGEAVCAWAEGRKWTSRTEGHLCFASPLYSVYRVAPSARTSGSHAQWADKAAGVTQSTREWHSMTNVYGTLQLCLRCVLSCCHFRVGLARPGDDWNRFEALCNAIDIIETDCQPTAGLFIPKCLMSSRSVTFLFFLACCRSVRFSVHPVVLENSWARYNVTSRTTCRMTCHILTRV